MSLTLRVEFYRDNAYTQYYGAVNIPITANFIDRTDPAWTIAFHDNFDDYTLQGWGGGFSGGVDDNIVRISVASYVSMYIDDIYVIVK